MKKILATLMSGVLVLSLTACSTNSKHNTGVVVGSIIGGILGNQVGKGRGKRVATYAGIITGAMIGGNIGRYMEDTDMLKAQYVLASNRSGQTTRWANPDTGVRYAVTPTRTYQRGYGRYCREYQTEVIIGGRREIAHGTACRQPDGTWSL